MGKQTLSAILVLALCSSTQVFAGKRDTCVNQPVNVPNTVNACYGSGTGCVDTSFGTNGVAPGPVPQGFLYKMAASDNQIVSGSGEVLQRFNNDGSADLSFGSGGSVVIPGSDSISGLAVDSSGKIYALTNLIVRRYNYDGTIDSTFGAGGTVTLSGVLSGNDLGIQADGKIVIAAALGSKTGSRWGYVRLLSTGDYDAAFGTNGIASSSIRGAARAMTFQSIAGEQRIVGATDGPMIVRFRASGAVDTSFGPNGNGTVTTTFFGGYQATIFIAVDYNNNIISGGEEIPAGCTTDYDWGFWRVTPNGISDSTFGATNPDGLGGGRVDINFNSNLNNANDRMKGMVVQTYTDLTGTHGRLLGAGWASTAGSTLANQFAIVALDDYGNFDSKFGTGGSGVSIIAPGAASALMLQPDGHLVAGGALNSSNMLIKLNP